MHKEEKHNIVLEKEMNMDIVVDHKFKFICCNSFYPSLDRVPTFWLDELNKSSSASSSTCDWHDKLLTKLSIRNIYEHEHVDRLSVVYQNDVRYFKSDESLIV